jgi:hypothetical protein
MDASAIIQGPMPLAGLLMAEKHMKIARINRHIARPVLAPAKRLRIESKRRKVVYFLYAGGLEPLRYPYTD